MCAGAKIHSTSDVDIFAQVQEVRVGDGEIVAITNQDDPGPLPSGKTHLKFVMAKVYLNANFMY